MEKGKKKENNNKPRSAIMSTESDVRKIVTINNRIAALEAERMAIYKPYEAMGQGAMDLINKMHEDFIQRQVRRKSEEA